MTYTFTNGERIMAKYYGITRTGFFLKYNDDGSLKIQSGGQTSNVPANAGSFYRKNGNHWEKV